MKLNGEIARAEEPRIAVSMRPQIEVLLSSLEELPASELPAVLSELEVACAILRLRMLKAPAEFERQQMDDVSLDVAGAAKRLGVSTTYVYRHAEKFSFARREGRRLLFSSRGIDQYLGRKR